MPALSLADVAVRAREGGELLVAVGGGVYNLTKFARLHPGGEVVLREYAGRDATEVFYGLHRADVLAKYSRLRVGDVAGAAAAAPRPPPGGVSGVPYAEASWLQGSHTAYYTDSHRRFQTAIRRFLDAEIRGPSAAISAADKHPPRELFRKLGAAGVLASCVGTGQWMEGLPAMGITLPAGVAPEQFDVFHELITHIECARFDSSWFNGHCIAVPAVVNFAAPGVRQRVLPELLRGEKVCAIAITEPFAGSDVANIKATAELSSCGRYYEVTGVKKWITHGMFADYFVTAVRTGGPGFGGISLLLVERGDGLTTKPLPIIYGHTPGTAYVQYDRVRVPVGNLLGKVNQGFRCIASSFNHERWLIIAGILGGMRGVVEDCFLWANQRKVFGKSLLSQPVIRMKLAAMFAGVESTQHWLENLTLQMARMSAAEVTERMGGPLALLKYHATRSTHLMADHAAQIFGGRGITKGGMGQRVESFVRTQKTGAIPGGSEEIMADLGVRQAMRSLPAGARL